MSQYGEGTATQNIYVEKPKNKKEINVRLSLFYDGTLNNRVNIDAREKNSKEFQKLQKKWFTSTTSFDNGRTNIAIMKPHLRIESDDHDIVLKEYIEGQGTFDLKGDSLVGYAMGGGDSGVVGRAEDGLTRGIGLIVKKIDSTEYCIKKLTIDVFGFSRGSATARYAIHLLLKGSSKIGGDEDFGQGYSQDVRPIIESIANAGIEIQEKSVEICFAGLYDTVLSYYGSQQLKFKWVGNVLEQTAVRHAKKSLHLVAADEHRADFALHNIKSAGERGEEYYILGVHSDVGGSYNKASDLALKVENDPDKKEYMLTTNENKIIFKNSEREILAADMQALIKQGWYINDNSKKEIEINERKIRKKRPGGKTHYYARAYELEVNREGICSAYCNIPLKIMAKYARDKGVDLKLNNKLDRRAQIILATSEDLKELENKINSYMDKVKGNGISKAEDWLGEKSVWNKYIVTNKIRNKHFNFSSHPDWGYSPRIEEDKSTKKMKRTRYVYDA